MNELYKKQKGRAYGNSNQVFQTNYAFLYNSCKTGERLTLIIH